MRKRNRLGKFLLSAVALGLGILFVWKFAGASILRLYIETGIGNCRQVPIFCMMPSAEINNPLIDREFDSTLIPYKSDKLEVWIPKGFTVVEELAKKFYYKKKKEKRNIDIAYVLYKEPGFFLKLYPQLRGQKVKDNYDFMLRLENARINQIQNITDAFFVILKGIFTPDLGDQETAIMLKFTMPHKKGFINYNLTSGANYFDCNIITNDDVFFKVYIKDTEAKLNLEKVITILSTLKAP